MKTWRIIIIVAILVAVLFAIVQPALRRAKIRGGPTCTLNLKLIQAAKMMCAEDHGFTNEVVFTKEQLLQYGLGGKWPQCPDGGEYSVGALHESPRCSYPTHAELQVLTK
jgi:hypothetical protein